MAGIIIAESFQNFSARVAVGPLMALTELPSGSEFGDGQRHPGNHDSSPIVR